MSMAIATSMSFAGFFDGNVSDLKVKGLYIGMPISDALVACKQSVEGTSASGWAEQMKIEKFGDGSSNIVIRNGFGMPLIMVVSDSNDKVNAFAFEWPAVNVIFNAADMSMKEFAQLFIDSYSIPKLEPDEKRENLEYTFPSGVKVIITGDKGVVVKKTQSESQKKSAFN